MKSLINTRTNCLLYF